MHPRAVDGNGGGPSLVEAEGVISCRFRNGLQLVVREDGEHPAVSMRCYVRGGSIAEWPQHGSGVAHLVEHVAATDVAREMQRRNVAAVVNAATARDHTCFSWKTLPDDGVEALRAFLDVLQARTDAQDWDEQVDRHRRVLIEELRPHEMDRLRRFRQQVLEQVLLVHPARSPVCGYSTRLQDVWGAAAAACWHRAYVPSNLCLVVAGACAPQSVVDAIIASGLALDARPRWHLPWEAQEPEQTADRVLDLQGCDADDEYTEVAFHCRGGLDEFLSLETVGTNFNDGREAILRTVFNGVASHAAARVMHTAFGIGGLAILVRHAVGAGRAAADGIRGWLQGTFALCTTLPAHGVAPLSRRPLQEQCAVLGLSAMRYEDPLATQAWWTSRQPEHHDGVSTRRQPVLDMGRPMVVGHLRPRAGASVTRPRRSPPEPAWLTLSNGVRLLALPSASAPSCCQLVGWGGALYESPEQHGLCEFMSRVLPTEFLPFCDQNLFGLSVSAEPGDMPSAVAPLLDCVMEPTYTDGQLEALRERSRSSQRRAGGWEHEALGALRRELFTHHPFGRIPLDERDAFSRFSLSDLEECHRRFFVGGSMVAVVSGRAATSALLSQLAERLQHLPSGVPAHATRDVVIAPAGPTETAIRGCRHSWVSIGFRGVAWHLPDWLALELAKSVLVGPQEGLATGRLVEALRGGGGNYAVQCVSQLGLDDGLFGFLAACDGSQASGIVDVVDDETARLRSGGVTDGELSLARRLYLLHHATLYENPRRQAFAAAQHITFCGTPESWLTWPHRLSAIDTPEISEAFARLLAPQRRVTVVGESAPSPGRNRPATL